MIATMTDEGETSRDQPERRPDLKFTGGRFDGLGFPLDGIQELAKYQKLVIEMAKQLWAEKNPGRPLPENIADLVRLRLVDIQPGSQKTYFASDPAPMFPGAPTLRELTEDAIYDLFDSIIKHNFKPLEAASPGVITAARAIGSGFTGEEAIAVRPERHDEVRFGVPQHRELLDALRGMRFERSGTLVGILYNLEAANKFSLVDGQGRTIPARFTDPTVWEALHTLHSRQDVADLIWIDCDYVISELDGSVVRISEVREANMFGKSANPWAVRLATFAALPEGHADGEGERTEVFALEAALEVLTSISGAGWNEPAIFPALDGGVRMEWLTENSHTVLTVDNEAHFYAFHLNAETDEEAIEEPVGASDALRFVERHAK